MGIIVVRIIIYNNVIIASLQYYIYYTAFGHKICSTILLYICTNVYNDDGGIDHYLCVCVHLCVYYTRYATKLHIIKLSFGVELDDRNGDDFCAHYIIITYCYII